MVGRLKLYSTVLFCALLEVNTGFATLAAIAFSDLHLFSERSCTNAIMQKFVDLSGVRQLKDNTLTVADTHLEVPRIPLDRR